MGILITADIQAEWSNLDLCEKAWNEILDICKKRKLELIAVLGDLKQAMNPVDVRVIKWWQYAIRKAKKLGIKVLIVLGNHDRVGAYSNADNWLPILKRAGAITFTKSGTYKCRNSVLTILPYMDNKTLRLVARKQCQTADPRRDILLFHCDLTGAKYNKQGSNSNANLSISDLHNNSYKYCIGGHIHLPQKLETSKNNRGELSSNTSVSNVYYVGSPFCHDWGEVNQRKRYLVVGKNSIRSVHSTIPRWFDPSVDGFDTTRPRNWKGSRIRIHVTCDASENYGRRLEKARRKAERKYRGAQIYVVPKFVEHSTTRLEGFTTSDSDGTKIKEYIRHTAESRARYCKQVSEKRIEEYMLEKLAHFAGGLRPQSEVKFIKAIGTNFLSFKKVKLDFTKGITLIQGINEDRVGKSNGSGKTSFMQSLPVALFGKTFKEQKHDRWSNRWITKEPAFAEVKMNNGKDIKIVRGRRPPLLRMYVNGKDVSSGMKTTDYEGTQIQIEKVTGFTWPTLANAVYIDRTVADSFLSGTKKQRTEVLSRFQNLERFDKALQLVKKDRKHAQELYDRTNGKLLQARGKFEEQKDSLHSMQQIQVSQVKAAKKAWERTKQKLKNWSNRFKFDLYITKVEAIKPKYKKLCKELTQAENKEYVLKGDCNAIADQLIKWKDLAKKHCPTCRQRIDKAHAKYILKDLIVKGKIALHDRGVAKKDLTKIRLKVQNIEGKHDELNVKIGKLNSEKRGLEIAVQTTWQQYSDMDIDTHNSKVLIHKKKDQMQDLKSKIHKLKSKLRHLKRKMRMYVYVMEAFSRDGIPAFLNKQLCPVLNKAADYYAELFSDREIQVQFIVEKGEFVPRIINDSGGAEIGDQSEGEKALAGLIASFALREAAPQCNVLFLDEPGAGLDEQTARQFAKSLRKLVKRFGSIFVATHNTAIASELGNERTITIQKKHKISKVLEVA